MDTQQLTQGLKQALFIEDHRIVFWYDPDQSFIDELGLLDFPNVTSSRINVSGFGDSLALPYIARPLLPQIGVPRLRIRREYE